MKHISVIPDVDVGKSGGGDADGTSGVVEETMLVALYHSCSVLILCMYLFFTLTNVLETSIILWPIQCFEPNNIRSTKTWVNGGRKILKKKKDISSVGHVEFTDFVLKNTWDTQIGIQFHNPKYLSYKQFYNNFYKFFM